METFPRVLNSVLLPTLGKPTIPICREQTEPEEQLLVHKGTSRAGQVLLQFSWLLQLRDQLNNPSVNVTHPTFRFDLNLPSTAFSTGSSFFLGGIAAVCQAVVDRAATMWRRCVGSPEQLQHCVHVKQAAETCHCRKLQVESVPLNGVTPQVSALQCYLTWLTAIPILVLFFLHR